MWGHSKASLCRRASLQLLFLDDEGVKVIMDKKLFDDLKQQITLEMENSCPLLERLLASINEANASFSSFRDIIKKFDLPENQKFDIVTHVQINFVETMRLHL